jgi:hypothetical protein
MTIVIIRGRDEDDKKKVGQVLSLAKKLGAKVKITIEPKK